MAGQGSAVRPRVVLVALLVAVLAVSAPCHVSGSSAREPAVAQLPPSDGGDQDDDTGAPDAAKPYVPLFSRGPHKRNSGSGPYGDGSVLGSFDDMTLAEFLGADGGRDGRPHTMWPTSGGPSSHPNGPPTPDMPIGVLCAVCNPRAQRCDWAYYGKPGRFCGAWADDSPTGHSAACCPQRSHCIMDGGRYIGCTAPEGSSGAFHRTDAVDDAASAHAAPVIGSTPWLLVWYVGGVVAAVCVSALWWMTHPTVKPVRPEDLPSLPERDAIVSFPLHRGTVFTTRATFTTVLLLLASCEAVVYLYVWLRDGDSQLSDGAWVRLVLLFLYGGVLGADLDALGVRRFVVSDSLLEVSRRLRRPVAIRLSQVVSVRRVESSTRLLLALRTPFHYCASYDDIVEVRYARDGCGPLSDCGRPYGIGVVLVTPQHADQFVVLLRQRAQFTKDRVSQAAVVAMDLDSQPISGGEDEEDEEVAEGSAMRRHVRSRPARSGWDRDDEAGEGDEPKTQHHHGGGGGYGVRGTEEAALLGHGPRPSAPPPHPVRGPKDAAGDALL